MRALLRLVPAIPLGLGLAFAPTGLAAAAPAAPCDLPSGALSPANLPEGTSVVECRAVGRVIRAGDQGLTIPGPGMGVRASSSRVSGHDISFGVEVSKDGRISYVQGQAAAAARTAASTTAAAAACDDPTYQQAGWKQFSAYEWYVGDGKLPAGMTRAQAATAFTEAIGGITRSTNDCGLPDKVSATATHKGKTSKESNIDASGNCTARDQTNTWDAGDLPSSTIAETCTFYEIRDGLDSVLESDVRYNTTDQDFTEHPNNGSCTSRYDVLGVGIHEAGHVFGLADLYGQNDNLTMYGYSFVCSSAARTLGKGDVLGLRSLY